MEEQKLKEFMNLKYEKYCAPFVVMNDKVYFDSVKNKLNELILDLEEFKINSSYIETVKLYRNKVINALVEYYQGNIINAAKEIDYLIDNCVTSDLAVSNIKDSIAFRGNIESEVQFFKARLNDNVVDFRAEEMLHIPFDKREIVKSERFSIPGLPCIYLANSTYGCWIEMGKPADHQFNVSPFRLQDTLKIFNLAVSIRGIDLLIKYKLNDKINDKINDYFKLLVLMIATSYRVEQKNRNFKSEYIISQLIMLSCKSRGINGITYYSKQVSEEIFASEVAVNLVLFASYSEGNKLSEICQFIETSDSFNFAMFKHLLYSLKYKDYNLRIDSSPYVCMIGQFDRAFPYKETAFYEFDKYLFSSVKMRKINL